MTRSLADLQAKIPDNAVWIGNVLGMFHDEAFVNVVASIVMPDGEKWVEQCLPKPLEMESYVREAVLFRWPDTPTCHRKIALPPIAMQQQEMASFYRRSTLRCWCEVRCFALTCSIPKLTG